MAQFARPISDSENNWASGGWADLDETSASDADFAYTADNPSPGAGNNGYLRVNLTGSIDPLSDTGHIARWRHVLIDGGILASSAGTGCALDVSLVQGVSTVIASKTGIALDAVLAWVDDSLTLSAGECDSITDYTDLDLIFSASGGGGSPSNRRGAGVSWAEFELPDGAGEPESGHSGQSGRPISDVENNWASGGWADIDEATPSDADFAYTADNPVPLTGNNGYFRVNLSSLGDPMSGANHNVIWRHVLIDGGIVASGAGSGCDLDVFLIQGAGTTIASKINIGLNAVLAWAEDSIALSSGEADAITDYTDLDLAFDADGGGGSPANRRGAGVSHAVFEIPVVDNTRAAIVTAFELEAENAPRAAHVTAFELEAEDAPVPDRTPVVEATNSSVELSEVTNPTIALPSGIQAGDMLLVFFTMSNQAFPTFRPDGFNNLNPPGTMNHSTGEARMRIYWKRADGTEGSTTSLTLDSAAQSAHVTYRISGAVDPEGVAHSEGNNTAPDPPALTPSLGQDQYLWIASCAQGESAGVINSAPTDYTDLLAEDTGAAAGDVCLGTARRKLDASTDNPDAFTSTVSQTWVAALIAMAPLYDKRPRRTIINRAVMRASNF